MRIYVTGIAGFLGSWIAESYKNDGHYVTGCDSLIGGEESNVPEGISWQVGDITDTDSLVEDFRRHKPEIVYHAAALAYEGLSVFSPALVTSNVFAGSTSVQSACIQAGVDYLVQCSSMARYGELTPPFNEDMECKPVDPYGLAKLSADQALQMLARVHGLNYTIAVPHNIIGPRQRYYDPYRNVASIMINRMLQHKPPIIYGDGSQTRCFSFIQDVLQCLTVIPFKSEAQGQVINIGPDEGTVSILELAKTLAKLVSNNESPIYMPGRPLEVKHARCSSDKARKLLNYETKWTLEDGLREMILHIASGGPREFGYHLPVEIISEKTPKTWTAKLI